MRHAFRFHTLILGLAILIGGASLSVAQGLPGGASSLNETHGDWRVACQASDGAVHCAISQIQVRGENRQRVLAIELTVAEGGNAATGMLVLPFGLNLDQGVVLSVDESKFLPPLRFSTCLPQGCLVPLAFDAATVTALRAGRALMVRTSANDSGQEMAFSISLSGFTSAVNRIAELSGP